MNEQAKSRMKTIISRKGSLADNAPYLVEEWDKDKNGDLTPFDLPAGSRKEVFWVCPKCGNSYIAQIGMRFRGSACPKCAPQRRQNTILQHSGSLEATNPELLAEWDYSKNTCSPSEITKGSNKKIWWKCSEGHSWQTTPSTRIKGHGCPYCSGRYVLPENSLFSKRPELAAEWHPTKNGEITPEMIAPYSMKKVWWKCERGHEWQASVSNRSQGRGCAQCSAGLKSSFPEQAILFYLSKVFNVESRNHIAGWEVDLFLPDYNIGIEYDGIAYHSKDHLVEREIRKTNDLIEAGVDLIRVKESYEREEIVDSVVYFLVDPSYRRLVKAIRMLFTILEQKTGFEIRLPLEIEQDRIEIMAQYTAIERRNNFSEKYHELVSLWNYDKNKGMKPENFQAMSNRKIWWKCNVCNGEWEESIINVAKGNRCPYCSGHRVLKGFNDLQTLYPDIASLWDYEKNGGLYPSDFSTGSGKYVWWKCPQGHSWKDSISNRCTVKHCTYCNETHHKGKTLDEAKWLSKFNRAKEFYLEHGHLEVPAKYVCPDGLQLGMWLRTQRSSLKNGNLTNKRKELLDSIGMVWQLKPGSRKKV